MGAFKIPPFDPERVDRFFCLAEDRFIALGIYHHLLKYSCVVEYLPPHLLELVQSQYEQISAAPDRYEAVKAAIRAYTLRPFWGRMNAIDALPSVGTMSPTQLMCKIVALKTPGQAFEDSLRYQFLKRLPAPLFERFKNKPWDLHDPMQFAVKVEEDWVVGMHGLKMPPCPLPTAGATSAAGEATATHATVSQVEEDAAGEDLLKPMIAAFQAMRKVNRGNARGRGRGQGRGGRGGNTAPPETAFRGESSRGSGGQGQGQGQGGRAAPANWCFFHQRFGRDAYSCRPPCSYDQRTAGDETRARQGQEGSR